MNYIKGVLNLCQNNLLCSWYFFVLNTCLFLVDILVLSTLSFHHDHGATCCCSSTNYTKLKQTITLFTINPCRCLWGIYGYVDLFTLLIINMQFFSSLLWNTDIYFGVLRRIQHTYRTYVHSFHIIII